MRSVASSARVAADNVNPEIEAPSTPPSETTGRGSLSGRGRAQGPMATKASSGSKVEVATTKPSGVTTIWRSRRVSA